LDFIEFLKFDEQDGGVYARFIQALPPNIMPYLKSELRKSKSNKLTEADLNEIHDLTMTQTSKNGSAEEPEFSKSTQKEFLRI
jgi:hypothetical protein